MVESWMVSFAIALAGSVSTYAVLRYRVSANETVVDKHIENDKIISKDADKKLDAQFRRIDALSDKITVLEQERKTFLNIKNAEEQFVQNKELDLHLKTLELKMQFTKETMETIQRSVEKTEGKLEELVSLLHKIN
jgi:hypothetical protein